MKFKRLEYDIVKSQIVDKSFSQDVAEDCRIVVDAYEYGVLEQDCVFFQSHARLHWGVYSISFNFTIHEMPKIECGSGYIYPQNVTFNLDQSVDIHVVTQFDGFTKFYRGLEHVGYYDIYEAILDLYENVQSYETLKQHVEDFGVARSSRRM